MLLFIHYLYLFGPTLKYLGLHSHSWQMRPKTNYFFLLRCSMNGPLPIISPKKLLPYMILNRTRIWLFSVPLQSDWSFYPTFRSSTWDSRRNSSPEEARPGKSRCKQWLLIMKNVCVTEARHVTVPTTHSSRSCSQCPTKWHFSLVIFY